MEDIKVYDFDLNLLHIENVFSSVDWLLKFNGIGTFEAHFPINSKIVNIAMQNDYLIVSQGNKQAIITGKSSQEDFALYGKTPNWILSKRVTPKFTGMSGTVEKLSATLVSEAFLDVPNFVVERVDGFSQATYFWRNVYNPTIKVISECLEKEKAGHTVYLDFDNKNWIYKAVKGRETDIVFSEGRFNVYNIKYSEDFQDYVNGGFYEYIDEDTGESVWEKISSDKSGIYKWMGVLGGNTLSDARASLATRSWDKNIKFETKGMRFNKDYFLGDRVSVKTKIGDFNRTDKKYISAVNIWYDNANSGEQPVFANL